MRNMLIITFMVVSAFAVVCGKDLREPGAELVVKSATQSKVSYEGYKLYVLYPKSAEQLGALHELTTQNFGGRNSQQQPKLDFWLLPRALGRPAQVMVRSDTAEERELLALLTREAIKHKIVHKNVQELIDRETATLASVAASVRGEFRFDQYHSHDEINVFLKSLANNPQYSARVSLVQIGYSYEGRHMLALKIGTPGTNKPAILVDAGIHAREWIAPATALYMLNVLITKYGSDPSIANYVDKIDWYFLPSVNPDGYEYTRNQDRLWRKSRSRQSCDWWKCCYGVDPNRNWGYSFGGMGTSNDSCSDIYHGPAAFSEPETKALSDFIVAHKNELKAYMTFHSFGQFFLAPFGDRLPVHYPDDYTELIDAAETAAKALERAHATQYTVGNSAALLYPAAGASDDWTKSQGVKYVYTMELRPDETTPEATGFMLPPEFIIPTAEETFEAVKVIADRVIALPPS